MGNSEKKGQLAKLKPTKIIIVGASQTGKTSFSNRFVQGTFSDKVLQTIGVEMECCVLKQDNGQQIKIQFWQFAGGCRFQEITKSYFSDSDGIFVFYDVMDEQSFHEVTYWISRARNFGEFKGAIMLIGNKLDLSDNKLNQRKVSTEEAMYLAKQHHVLYGEMSVKQNYNLKECVNKLIEEIKLIQDYDKN